MYPNIHRIHRQLVAAASAVTLLSGFGVPCDAQVASQPAGPAVNAGATRLRVADATAELRSRPDANSLVVATAAPGALLEALERDAYGWHRVRPPEGVFSYVSAEFIDRRSSTEGFVSVRSGTLRVRVGSLVHEVDPERSETQTRLERGAVVQILGEDGGWLKIAAPNDVFLYVSAEQVRPVAATEAAAASEPAAPVTSAPAPTAAAPDAEPPARPQRGPDLSGPWGRQLAAIERDVATESRRPPAEQSWSGLLERLVPIAEQREEPMVAQLAEAWRIQLAERAARQAMLRDAAELLRRAERDQSQHEREMERITRAHAQTTRPAFAARGTLRRSFAMEERDGQRWYKLEDPVTRRIEAYVVAAAGAGPVLEAHLGAFVGVRGERRPSAKLGADVVEVREIVPLVAEPPASRPARQAGRAGVNSRPGLDTREDVQ